MGGGLTGEIGDFMIRGEGAYFFAEDSRPMAMYDGDLYEDHLEYVLGISLYYQGDINADMEYYHNGAAVPDNLNASFTRLIKGANKHLSRDLIGLSLSFNLSPLFTGQVASIYSFDDSSFSIQPFFTYSVTENADFLFGASINLGDTPLYKGAIPSLQSEFGSYPNAIYAEYKLFF